MKTLLKKSEPEQRSETVPDERPSYDVQRATRQPLWTLQGKLKVSEPGDEHEREADRVAEQVLRIPDPKPPATLHEGGTLTVDADTQQRIESLRGGGRQLPSSLRREFESRLGATLGGVRIHEGERAAALSRDLDAQAFTHGQDVYFGRGNYRPETEAGRRLLAHELVHTVQGDRAISRQDSTPEVGSGSGSDPATELGKRLWREFPYGVNVVFYEQTNDEARRKAKEWAANEQAVGTGGGGITAANLSFGVAFSDTRDVVTTIQQLETVLSEAATKARAAGGVTPPSEANPSKIRNLALFAHGDPDWCGITGSDIKVDPPKGSAKTSVTSFVGSIAGSLASDVNVILYACNVARSPSEKHQWRPRTLKGGGAESLAGEFRDQLVDAGLTESTVWGHSTLGHVTTNFALQVFNASTGKGTPGSAYAGEIVFGLLERAMAVLDLRQTIQERGYAIPEKKRKEFNKIAYAKLERLVYSAYARANEKVTYEGRNLAEAAPVHPLAVRKLILEYWLDEFWPDKRDKLANTLISRLGLPKQTKNQQTGSDTTKTKSQPTPHE